MRNIHHRATIPGTIGVAVSAEEIRPVVKPESTSVSTGPLLPPPWDDGSAGPRIRDVRVILTAQDDIRLVIVKVETDEP